MAEGSRFPHLAPPFAVAGAAGGWLSASMAANPIVQGAETNTYIVATVVAMLAGAVTGLLLTRWCVGKRLWYQIDDIDPETQAHSDRWWRHVPAVLVAGALSGAIVAILCRAYNGAQYGAAGGAACAAAFLPVCAAVIVTARRARRARLGSIVAASDRRAVWGILATAITVATLEVAPSWAASAGDEVPRPTPVLGILGVAAAVIGAVLFADARALRRARAAAAPGLEQADLDNAQPADTDAPRVDLGLGDDLGARVARGAAYRGRDRTLALVMGSPERAIAAMRRALVRGAIGLALVGAVSVVHWLAMSEEAQRTYDRIACEGDHYWSCGRLADNLRAESPGMALVFYDRACAVSDGASCAAAAAMYENGEGVQTNTQMASHYYSRACDEGHESSCTHSTWHPYVYDLK